MTLPVPQRMRIDSLLYRAVILCRVCSNRIMPGQKIVWDHGHAHGLDGPHDYKNVGPIHAEATGEFACNKRKTFGNGATTAGSDVGNISKMKRIERTQKMAVLKRKPIDMMEALREAVRRDEKRTRKIKSRGFDKTRTKHLDGTTSLRHPEGERT